MKNDIRTKAFVIAVFYICVVCFGCSVFADDFIDNEGNPYEIIEDVITPSPDPVPASADPDQELKENEGILVQKDYSEDLQKISNQLNAITKDHDEIISDFEQLNKNLDQLAKTLKPKDTKADPEEITISTIHDDNYKIMAVIFIGFGIILGFLIISKVLL